MAQKKLRKPRAKPQQGRRQGLIWGGVVALALAVGGALFYFSNEHSYLKSFPQAEVKKSVPAAARFVGGTACAECHAKEYEAWRGSQHSLAMQDANESTVLGNFANAKFSYAGVASTFFKLDGKFYVNTDGPGGRLADFAIKYTFGIYPLQQYLIEFADGRLQALSIAWDARPKIAGGQRWFHVYANELITHNHELHWTRPAQNWNFMCADCHSTNLRKNYDPGSDGFKTEWSEISVGCEACHGPGSNHVTWARTQFPPLKKGGQGGFKAAEEIPLNPPFTKGEEIRRPDAAKGLTVALDERRGVRWDPNEGTGNAARSRARGSEREIEVCAQCHARRGQIAEGYQAGEPFLDYYRPALLASPLYHADGQQRGEVYNWGSFLQSKMHANGVTCSDCHDPHSGKLRAEGNAVCAACHLPSKYDSAAHHHHQPGGAGAACAACHMPTAIYMVVDPRHDHSLRVPRPDLSAKLGTPNACNGCHRNRDARWAAAEVKKWHGREPQGYQRYADAFAAAEAGALDAQSKLQEIAADAAAPAIARATALAQSNATANPAALDAITQASRDPSALVRFGALLAIANLPLNARVLLAAPLLSDSARALRIEAASLLAALPTEQLNGPQRAALERAANEYIETQRFNSDRAEARVNLGTYYGQRGDAARAEAELKAAIRLEPYFTPAYVNLADIYRARGRDADGERMLREGLKVTPKSAVLHHALGLALVRLKRTDAALGELERATVLDPGNARFAYVYAVALHSSGKVEAAIARLKKALAVSPNDRDILEALASFYASRGELAEAEKYAEQLRRLTNQKR